MGFSLPPSATLTGQDQLEISRLVAKHTRSPLYRQCKDALADVRSELEDRITQGTVNASMSKDDFDERIAEYRQKADELSAQLKSAVRANTSIIWNGDKIADVVSDELMQNLQSAAQAAQAASR